MQNYYFSWEINPPDAVNGGGGKWYRYVLPSDWIKDNGSGPTNQGLELKALL